jgi:hypothetical protein
MKLRSHISLLTFVLSIAVVSWAGDSIPKAAWRRPLGLPPDHPGVTRVRAYRTAFPNRQRIRLSK